MSKTEIEKKAQELYSFDKSNLHPSYDAMQDSKREGYIAGYTAALKERGSDDFDVEISLAINDWKKELNRLDGNRFTHENVHNIFDGILESAKRIHRENISEGKEEGTNLNPAFNSSIDA